MNVTVKAVDSDGNRIKKTTHSGFYNQFDGYKVDYVEFSGCIDTAEEARLMSDFFRVVEESLK
jgi:hypothetical protein